MDGDHKGPSDGSKAAKIVGIVLASVLGLSLVCCGGLYVLGYRLIDELGEIAGAQVQGSGVTAVQERLLRDFRGIETDGLINIDVELGDDWFVEVSADDNILPLIATEVRGATLHFSTRGSYSAES
jgi:hypothetical protein